MIGDHNSVCLCVCKIMERVVGWLIKVSDELRSDREDVTKR